MIQKLLRKNISIPQLLGYAFAALTGMVVIFTAFCFSRDVQPLFAPKTGLFKTEFMVINKKVPMFSVLASDNTQTAFTRAEVEELKQQPFVQSLSAFTPSLYEVVLYTTPSRQVPYFSTDLFFESVPDKLLIENFPDWTWKEGMDDIPIIIPRYYLNLYNFGFAQSQGLPQVSEELMQQIVFKVKISGNGRTIHFSGHIDGFSDDLNTILVPESFMTWANLHFGDKQKTPAASRLIMEVNNPAAPEIAEFFAGKPAYDLNSNKGEQGKLSYFLTILIVIILAVGLTIMLPAIGLMLLSINLLIHKNQETLGNLILLGYRRGKLALPYCLLVLVLNVIVGVFALVITYYARLWYSPKLQTLGVTDFSSGWAITITFSLLFVLLVSLLDMVWIRHKIQRIRIPVKG